MKFTIIFKGRKIKLPINSNSKYVDFLMYLEVNATGFESIV